MTRRLRLLFLVTLLMVLGSGKSGRLLASGDEYCNCGYFNYYTPYGYVYLYEYANGTYWNFVDQFTYDAVFYIPDEYEYDCAGLCSQDSTQFARFICNAYGNANRHVQVQFWYFFQDDDNSNGGSSNGSFDTGATIYMCGSF
jgi:hypothetical protein